MVNFLSMPALKMPDNALIDFQGAAAPLTNALSGYRQGMNQQYGEQQRLEQQGYQRGRDAKADSRQQVEWFGKQAAAIDRIQDPAQRGAIWNRILSKHPDAANLGPEYRDPMNGPKLVAAEAGQWRDPREDQLADLKLQGARLDVQKSQRELSAPNEKYIEMGGKLVAVGPGGAREVYSSPDPLKEILAKRLGGGQPQQQQAPMLQPQSAPGANPLLKRVADEVPGVPAQAQPAPDQIDTIYGAMTRQEAQDLAGAMLLDPRYQAAGKALLDGLQAGKGELSKPVTTQVEEKALSAAGTMGRLQEIKRLFRPEFLTIPNKLKMVGASWGSSFGGKLDPQTERDLRGYSQFKAAAFDNFNQILKELSGTAVSAQELTRQQIVQPNPGEGLFDGDDPVSFKAKIEQVERLSRAAVARMNYIRSRGLQFNKDTAEQFLRLEDVPAALDKRGSEIEAEIRRANPKADPMAIDKAVRQQIMQEFGI